MSNVVKLTTLIIVILSTCAGLTVSFVILPKLKFVTTLFPPIRIKSVTFIEEAFKLPEILTLPITSKASFGVVVPIEYLGYSQGDGHAEN